MYKVFMLMMFSLKLLAVEAITPIPFEIEHNKEKAELGKKLFFDTILSKDNSIACVSCHQLPGSGANSTAYSFGIDGAEGDFNSPTVLNSIYNFKQFWDGRAENLKEQVSSPITNHLEMAETIDNVIKKLNNSQYKKEFLDIYKDGVTQTNLADAIAEFEKILITPNSRFDKYLRDDVNAIDDREKKGYELFKDLGCISCHNGVSVGGNMYQISGLVKEYKQDKPLTGRFKLTLRERDKNIYKVPSLRNIELTAPYFHDGQMKTLKDAIDMMIVIQIGIEPKKEETELIELFLKTLTGETPKIIMDMR